MTLRTNSRLAGIAFLTYIAAGITSLVMSGRATRGTGIAEKLVTVAQHGTDIGIVSLLGWVQVFSALVLAVTLYALTRDEDPDLARLGMVSRVGEGLVASLSIPNTMAFLWLGTLTGLDTLEPGATRALGAYLLRGDVAFTATFFAVGSTLFAYLMLRGRLIPVGLAWIGVLASVLLVVCLPLQVAGFLRGPLVTYIWLPMLAFEVPLAVWLIARGVRPRQTVDSRSL